LPKGYRYIGKRVGDVMIRSLKITADKITVKGVVPFSLDEEQQGRLSVSVVVGPTQYCGEAPAKTRGNPPSSARFDNTKRFVGAPDTPPPAACPPLP